MNATSLVIAFSLLSGGLGSNSFPARDQASATLEKLLPLSLPWLRVMEFADDVETQVRACQIVDSWYERTAAVKAAALSRGNYPWIDGLPWGTPGRQATIDEYLRLARILLPPPRKPGWPDYRLATKLWLEDLLAARHEPEELCPIVALMRINELTWLVSKY